MGELTLIAATLQRLVSEGKLHVPAVARDTGLDDSTIYKWISGATEPGFTNVALLFRHCHDRDVQQALLSCFTGGASVYAMLCPDELDVNGDGREDLGDALDSCISASESVARELAGIRVAWEDRKIDDAERASLHAGIDRAMGQLACARAVVDLLHAREQRRHQLQGGRRG